MMTQKCFDVVQIYSYFYCLFISLKWQEHFSAGLNTNLQTKLNTTCVLEQWKWTVFTAARCVSLKLEPRTSIKVYLINRCFPTLLPAKTAIARTSKQTYGIMPGAMWLVYTHTTKYMENKNLLSLCPLHEFRIIFERYHISKLLYISSILMSRGKKTRKKPIQARCRSWRP